MSKFPNLIGILAGFTLVFLAIALLVHRPQPQHNPAPAASTGIPAPADASASTTLAPGSSTAKKHLGPVPTSPDREVRQAAPLNLITNWEEKVDEILGGEKDDREKARQMLELFPRVPVEGQAEVAQHLANLTPNEDFSALAQLLIHGGVSEGAQDTLMQDVLNRPNSVKLPVLLEVARDPQNPKAGEAKDVLQLFLEEDLGTDWTAWQMKLEQWLKDNPD